MTEKNDVIEQVENTHAIITEQIESLDDLSIRLRAFGGGNRELSIAITNLQQGLLWLNEAKAKL